MGHYEQQMGGDDPVAPPRSGRPGCGRSGPSLLDVGAIRSEALCSLVALVGVGSIGKELANFDAYAARR